jgi:hypothetical protein
LGQVAAELLWAQLAVNVPSFTRATTIDLLVPCTYDFDVVATKYPHSLDADHGVPLELRFSGTVLFAGDGDRLQATSLSWGREAGCEMPVGVWRETLDRAFPGTVWLRLARDVFDQLQQYKANHALLTWEGALERLLAAPQAAP